LSEASVALMQDTFWWFFLDKFDVSGKQFNPIHMYSCFNNNIVVGNTFGNIRVVQYDLI